MAERTKLSWLAPHPDMMFCSTQNSVFRIIREDDECFSLTREPREGGKQPIGTFPTKRAAVEAAENAAASGA